MNKENPNTRGSERNATPLSRMLMHPEKFDPDKLTVNEITQPNGTTLAKIPKIPGRICRRTKASGDGTYIELILSHHYDSETKQNQNKKVIIGEDISHFLKGMMVINDSYHEYINSHGIPLPHIQAQWAEEDRRKQQPDPQPKQNQTTTSKQTGTQNQAKTPNSKPETTQQRQQPTAQLKQQPQNDEEEASEVQIKELKKREKALDLREERLNQKEAELDELQAELENQQMVNIIQVNDAAEDHIKLLRDILTAHTELIEAQAKRRPDTPMSQNQIRTINEVLQELRTCFQNSEIEDYLHLATEPNEETNTPATTYGEMSLLLNAYGSMLHQFVMGRLRTK